MQLQIESLSKTYPNGVKALQEINMNISNGLFGLLGPNGAGKSTLLKVLSGAHLADEGTMSLHGNLFWPQGPSDSRRSGVAMIYQELSLAPHLSVMENILLGVEPHECHVIGGVGGRDTVNLIRYLRCRSPRAGRRL